MGKSREVFETKYRELHPNDKCTLMANGDYSGWIKQVYWEAWQSRQDEVDDLTNKNKEAYSREIKEFEKNLILKAEVEEKDKRITELEKSEFALAKVKQILNKRINTKLLESIIVRELIDLLFSDKERVNNANS